ncbi:hypothetical protein [Amycolatopsis sp. VC5-11]
MKRVRWQPYPHEPLFGWADDHPVWACVFVVACIVGVSLLATWSGMQS